MPGTLTPQRGSSGHGFKLAVSYLYQAAFDKPRDPRSAEYKAGVRAALAYRIEGTRIPRLYMPGTAQDDAYHAGMVEGHRISREASLPAGGAA